MGVCTAFVFAALVEFTFVNYLWRKTTMRAYAGKAANVASHSTPGENGGGNLTPRPNDDVELNLVKNYSFIFKLAKKKQA